MDLDLAALSEAADYLRLIPWLGDDGQYGMTGKITYCLSCSGN